ncbi:ACT domain-containing protein [Coriobacteriales bacterium OH1046]|nr:ACT domain-containing protein [Coriobacteriales bacterium OH1046]
MKRVIVTVVGKDAVGIIARLCAYMAEHNINILDITQTIVSGFFNMMMIVDMAQATAPFDVIATELETCGRELGVIVKCQREEIFDSMHRL